MTHTGREETWKGIWKGDIYGQGTYTREDIHGEGHTRKGYLHEEGSYMKMGHIEGGEWNTHGEGIYTRENINGEGRGDKHGEETIRTRKGDYMEGGGGHTRGRDTYRVVIYTVRVYGTGTTRRRGDTHTRRGDAHGVGTYTERRGDIDRKGTYGIHYLHNCITLFIFDLKIKSDFLLHIYFH